MQLINETNIVCLLLFPFLARSTGREAEPEAFTEMTVKRRAPVLQYNASNENLQLFTVAGRANFYK